ncbi:hypothetical protein AAFF_G00256130, partial [Aldrovandia affinis]
MLGNPFSCGFLGVWPALSGSPQGIPGLRAENFSLIAIVFGWIPGAQSPHNVTALDDGSFFPSPDWTLPSPGTQRITVEIYTDKQVYATGTDITFLAVSDEPGPLEFLWYFGDRAPRRTTSRSITKRYHIPDRYNVVVNASKGLSSCTSDVHPIIIQREVHANRLLYATSVLLDASVRFDCRINQGTNVSYLW